MANVSENRGFVPHEDKRPADHNEYTVLASQVTREGDVLRMGTAGTVRATTAGSGYPIVGIQKGNIFSPTTGAVRTGTTVAVAGDKVKVYDDPMQVFLGKISTYALTDPYSTRKGSTCYDEAGSAGAQYIASSLSTLDTFHILGPDNNFQNGERSTTGANATVRCRFNLTKHISGLSGVTS